MISVCGFKNETLEAKPQPSLVQLTNHWVSCNWLTVSHQQNLLPLILTLCLYFFTLVELHLPLEVTVYLTALTSCECVFSHILHNPRFLFFFPLPITPTRCLLFSFTSRSFQSTLSPSLHKNTFHQMSCNLNTISIFWCSHLLGPRSLYSLFKEFLTSVILSNISYVIIHDGFNSHINYPSNFLAPLFPHIYCFPLSLSITLSQSAILIVNLSLLQQIFLT